MMRSMYSGVAGLKTHQTKMDVIGNNIANVNTVAFKSQSVTFSELMYQTTQNASGANAQTGTAGINARQIGLGVKTGAINTAISSQGASQTTNNPFDIRITGDSFFIVSNGLDNFFTRDGSFYVDGLGNLAMTSNGYNVMGWQVDPETMDIKQDTVSALRIMSAENMTYDPEATTKARVTGIIDKLDTNLTSSSGKNMNLMFYDKLGYSYTAKINLKTTDTDGMYAVTLAGIVDSDNNPVQIPADLESNILSTQGSLDTANLITALNNAIVFVGNNVIYTGSDNAELGLTQNDIVYTRNQTATPDWEKIAAALTAGGVTGISAESLQTLRFSYTDNTGSSSQTIEFTMKDILDDASFVLGDGTTNITARQMLDTSVKDHDGNTLTQTVIDALTAAKNVKATGQTTTNLYYNVATGKFEGIGTRGANNTTITLNISGIQTLNPLTNEYESNFENIDIDFSPTTMFNNSGTSTIAASSGDANKIGAGRKLGKMSGVSIQDDGRIYASYDNGMSRLLGQIAVAEFANASGLEKKGDNLYKNTQNSGDFDGIGIDIKSGGGYMTTGVLEMSNVDLSAEFTDMITTQRGFQANSRIITVSDTLLEELVNLKR
ncbi:MAG: flagellar hook-basal body complex protein [Lachnospiraceae bacterium]|nr:flagellar hook-basal body complex protein [Lachnospiraceae bacterium]